MSSKIEFPKICEYCGNEFIAKTTVTRFCSHKCNQRDYKQRLKDQKIEKALAISHKPQDESPSNPIGEIQQKEFLSIKEAATLLGVSERTFFRLMKNEVIKSKRLGKRTIISRSEINKIFTQ